MINDFFIQNRVKRLLNTNVAILIDTGYEFGTLVENTHIITYFANLVNMTQTSRYVAVEKITKLNK